MFLKVENGPCFVNADSNSTRINEWAWNNEVNMLFLDQPVQVGFSYDTLQNVSINIVTGERTLLNASDPIPEQNATFRVGTYASQERNQTTRGSVNGAKALWHFAQSWFGEFPEYKPNDDRISLSTQSYGGRYGPATFAYFQEQNERILNGSLPNEDGEYIALNLDTLLIVNGCIDRLVQWPSYPQIVRNNTYGIEAVNETTQAGMFDALYRSGGCQDQIWACHNASIIYDPENIGINATVNELCQEAESFCNTEVRTPYNLYSGRNYYDYTALEPLNFPYPFYQGYLQQPHVQAALGVPLNFSQSSPASSAAVRSIGDYVRPGWLEDIAYLLDEGIKVQLMFGDRDYACVSHFPTPITDISTDMCSLELDRWRSRFPRDRLLRHLLLPRCRLRRHPIQRDILRWSSTTVRQPLLRPRISSWPRSACLLARDGLSGLHADAQ
jgi:carboxypeptidase C (cathepsin A)